MKGLNVFMKVLVKQINKELFEANFDIIENDVVVGNLHLKGHLGTPEVKLTGKLYDREFYMERIKQSKGKFRPYSISENNNIVGEVYQAEAEQSWWKKMLSSKPYFKCVYNGQEYNSDAVAIVDNKVIAAIFNNEKQIAQCENDTTIYNELYNFDIYCNTTEEVLISVFIISFRYIMGYYKAGEKVTKSVRTMYSSKLDWADKYNPNWVNELK